MIRLALSDAAYDTISSTLPKGSARWPMQRDRGQCFIQVESAIVDRMRAMRRPGESYSAVILRLVELETGDPKVAERARQARSEVSLPGKAGGLRDTRAARSGTQGSLTRPLEFVTARGGLSAPEVHLLQPLIFLLLIADVRADGFFVAPDRVDGNSRAQKCCPTKLRLRSP